MRATRLGKLFGNAVAVGDLASQQLLHLCQADARPPREISIAAVDQPKHQLALLCYALLGFGDTAFSFCQMLSEHDDTIPVRLGISGVLGVLLVNLAFSRTPRVAEMERRDLISSHFCFARRCAGHAATLPPPKEQLIRWTVPGSTPNRAAILLVPSYTLAFQGCPDLSRRSTSRSWPTRARRGRAQRCA